MNTELLEFTRQALQQGVSRERIAIALKDAGWSDADIRAADGAFASADFPVPVPRPRPYLSAREVFVYALFFTALYVSAWNAGALFFHLIDLSYPDGASTFDNPMRHHEGIRRNVAALLVAFPLFVFLFRMLRRGMAADPLKRQSRPRRWLTYLTMFIAAATLIGDFSVLFYQLLGGELTVRFVLKFATVAVIAGGAFAYFLLDIRADERT